MPKKILITGAAGFIGFHLSKRLMQEDFLVTGIDNMNDYYDVDLKNARLDILLKGDSFQFKKIDLLDTDKIKESGLTPIASQRISSPGFEEGELIIECKKIYYQDINPDMFLADYIPPMYHNDYHRGYFGEVLGIWGVKKYKLNK